MSAYRFSLAPNISVPRSRFKMDFTHSTSFNHGKLVPIDCFEILPGDEFKLDLKAVVRMSTPIAPIFSNIKGHLHAFFIPMRLVWSHTKEFYGENKTAQGYQSYNYQIPHIGLGPDSTNPVVGSVSHYLGKPLTNSLQSGGGYDVDVSVLKERCYFLVWSEYYRAQQVQAPFLLNDGDTGAIGTITSGNMDYLSTTHTCSWQTTCMNVCKEFDYFTACTTAPQYGSSVSLPLGTSAPIIGDSTQHSIGANGITFGTSATSKVSNANLVLNGSSKLASVSSSNSGAGLTFTNMIADLSNATAASINSIRYAFACQKWLERANFGSRFFEMLNLHYGITSPDARLQRPEYLGGKDFFINIDQVVSTADYSASSSQKVGQTGALSVSGVNAINLFHKAFVEPGYVLILMSTTHERSYTQGILREDLRKDRFDFYFPEFANLGDQSVYNCEIALRGNGNDKSTFGYQEHWAEYRYRPNRVSGILDPSAPNALTYWTTAEKFTSMPVLNNTFIMEDRNEITRCLVSGSSGPDYIGDFYFDYTAVREMPLYTIPGLVDHFGTM